MKQLKTKFMAMLAIAGVVAFSSCDPEDEGLAGPTISFTTTPAHTDNVISAEVGDEVSITVNVNAPGGFNVLRASGGIPDQEWLRTEEGQTSYSTTIDLEPIEAAAAGGFLEIEFEAVDDQDSVTTKTLRINVAAAPIESFTAILLGSQGNATQGFLSLLTGDKYGYAGARDNTSSVDLGYYWGANDNSSLASVDDANMDAVYSSVNLPIDGVFGTANLTRFVLLPNSTDFAGVSNAAELEELAVFETSGASRITDLAVGNVIAFKTGANRGGGVYGLIKVTAVNDTNGTGTITIEVKVPVTE